MGVGFTSIYINIEMYITVSQMSQLSKDISNVFTSSGMVIFTSLYTYSMGSMSESISKTLLESLGLSGIIVASVYTSKEEGTISGIVRGILVLLVSFVIPNLTLHIFPNMFRRKLAAVNKAVFGISILSILVLIERYVVPRIAH